MPVFCSIGSDDDDRESWRLRGLHTICTIADGPFSVGPRWDARVAADLSPRASPYTSLDLDLESIRAF